MSHFFVSLLYFVLLLLDIGSCGHFPFFIFQYYALFNFLLLLIGYFILSVGINLFKISRCCWNIGVLLLFQLILSEHPQTQFHSYKVSFIFQCPVIRGLIFTPSFHENSLGLYYCNKSLLSILLFIKVLHMFFPSTQTNAFRSL